MPFIVGAAALELNDIVSSTFKDGIHNKNTISSRHTSKPFASKYDQLNCHESLMTFLVKIRAPLWAKFNNQVIVNNVEEYRWAGAAQVNIIRFLGHTSLCVSTCWQSLTLMVTDSFNYYKRGPSFLSILRPVVIILLRLHLQEFSTNCAACFMTIK